MNKLNKFKSLSMSNQLKDHQNKEESYMDSQINLFNNYQNNDSYSGSRASSASTSESFSGFKRKVSHISVSNVSILSGNQSSAIESGKEVTGNYSMISSADSTSNESKKDVTDPIDKAKSEIVEWQDVNGKKKVPTYELSKAMLDNFSFWKVRSTDQSDRLFMYVNTKDSEYFGTFTNNRDQMEQTFRLVDPNFSSNTFDNVALGIKAHSKVLNISEAKRKLANLIPVKNGLFDMRSKKLKPFSPKYFVTKKLATPYPKKKPQMPVIKDIRGNTWTPQKFMDELSNGDKGTQRELWQVMLDSFDTRKTRGKFIILEGPASTGKSSYEDIIINVVGVNNVAGKTINQLSGRFAPADLVGKIVDIGDNLETDIKIKNSSTLHALTTGDDISVEPKGEKAFTVRMTCTIINSSNGLPRFSDIRGIKRRLLIIPLNHKFHDDGNEVKNDYLSRRDVREWFLYTALNQPDFNSYYVSPKSKKMLRDYIVGSNPLKQFELEYFNKWNLEKIPTKVLYKYFEDFTSENNYKPISSASFSRQFKRLIRSRYVKKTAKLSNKDIQAIAQVNRISELSISMLQLLKRQKSYKCFVKIK